MKTYVLWLLTIAALAPYPMTAEGADQPPKRAKMKCAELRTTIESVTKHMKMPLKITPGSWGDVPAPLRKLPGGAENCGVGNHGQVIIASPAFGKELEDHYAPLLAELGCKPLKCRVTSTTDCSCSGADGVGTLLTDTGAEYYTVMYIKLKKK
jgi:hypothetical protein